MGDERVHAPVCALLNTSHSCCTRERMKWHARGWCRHTHARTRTMRFRTKCALASASAVVVGVVVFSALYWGAGVRLPSSDSGTAAPTAAPTGAPTAAPTTAAPTTAAPTAAPTTAVPTAQPTDAPTMAPTTAAPTAGGAPAIQQSDDGPLNTTSISIISVVCILVAVVAAVLVARRARRWKGRRYPAGQQSPCEEGEESMHLHEARRGRDGAGESFRGTRTGDMLRIARAQYERMQEEADQADAIATGADCDERSTAHGHERRAGRQKPAGRRNRRRRHDNDDDGGGNTDLIQDGALEVAIGAMERAEQRARYRWVMSAHKAHTIATRAVSRARRAQQRRECARRRARSPVVGEAFSDGGRDGERDDAGGRGANADADDLVYSDDVRSGSRSDSASSSASSASLSPRSTGTAALSASREGAVKT